jgi:5-methylcytosine-specific restriction endonuclease McrA
MDHSSFVVRHILKEPPMAAVLLLNASYEPLSIIPERRALALLLRDRADAASDETIALASASTVLQIPTVVRLRRYVKVPRRGTRWSRQGVLRRDGYRCIYCGIEIGQRQRGRLLTRPDFTLDHLMPRSRGGRNTWSNTACACPVCNHRKGDRTPNEAGMALRWEPKTPRVDYLIVGGERPKAWKLYLPL